MRKLLLILFCLVFVVGCANLMNTPTKKVEYLLSKYQKNDKDVLDQLNDSLVSDTVLDDNQRQRYNDIMKRQYKDLTYKVKNEAIDGNTAVVEVEIEVYDYYKTIKEIESKLIDNSEQYKDDTGEINNTLYNDEKLSSLEKTNDRIKYTINFTLSRVDEEWIVDDLTETERMKIHGLYAY